MRLESLPKMKRLVQSEITNALVRQLTCLLNLKRNGKNKDQTVPNTVLDHDLGRSRQKKEDQNFHLCFKMSRKMGSKINKLEFSSITEKVTNFFFKKIPRIHRIPEPLGTVAHRDPISRQFCSSLFSTQWGKLPKMLIPWLTKQIRRTYISHRKRNKCK